MLGKSLERGSIARSCFIPRLSFYCTSNSVGHVRPRFTSPPSLPWPHNYIACQNFTRISGNSHSRFSAFSGALAFFFKKKHDIEHFFSKILKIVSLLQNSDIATRKKKQNKKERRRGDIFLLNSGHK